MKKRVFTFACCCSRSAVLNIKLSQQTFYLRKIPEKMLYLQYTVVLNLQRYRHTRCNISNTRKSVSSGYPNTEKWVEKTRRSRVFLTDFEVFGYLMKHSFEFLIWLLKPFIILGEIQSRSSQNFMLIKIRYPNHRHGSDFLCFLFMNY